jgi:hypothetical protein
MTQSRMFSVVSPSEANRDPYPYVYVNNDRTVRELHQSERNYLEEAFSPFDGGRPYIKDDFEARDGWGSIKGFCHRSRIPQDLRIGPAPVDDPNSPMSKLEYIEWLKKTMKTMAGFEIVERGDGAIEMKRIAKK